MNRKRGDYTQGGWVLRYFTQVPFPKGLSSKSLSPIPFASFPGLSKGVTFSQICMECPSTVPHEAPAPRTPTPPGCQREAFCHFSLLQRTLLNGVDLGAPGAVLREGVLRKPANEGMGL